MALCGCFRPTTKYEASAIAHAPLTTGVAPALAAPVYTQQVVAVPAAAPAMPEAAGVDTRTSPTLAPPAAVTPPLSSYPITGSSPAAVRDSVSTAAPPLVVANDAVRGVHDDASGGTRPASGRASASGGGGSDTAPGARGDSRGGRGTRSSAAKAAAAAAAGTPPKRAPWGSRAAAAPAPATTPVRAAKTSAASAGGATPPTSGPSPSVMRPTAASMQRAHATTVARVTAAGIPGSGGGSWKF